GGRDWLGTDDGTRALPGVINRITSGGRENPSIADSRAYASTLPNIYDLRRRTAPADLGLSGSMGDGFAVGSGLLGYYAAVKYGRGTGSHQQGTRADPRNVTQSTYNRASTGTQADGY